MSRQKETRLAVSLELGTLQKAVEGVVSLSEWAYGQTDGEARKMLPKITAVLELVADRMGDLDRTVRGDDGGKRTK